MWIPLHSILHSKSDGPVHGILADLRAFCLQYPINTVDADKPITELLRRYNGGDQSVWEELVPYVYDDLRRLAHQRMRHERSGHTLSTTALVNECYLRLVENRKLAAGDRGEFMALVSQTMRRLLVDHARARRRLKRGPDVLLVPLDDLSEWLTDREADEVISLDEALNNMKSWDARAAQVVELRFFGGLSLEETAAVVEVSAKTVQRTWIAARAWLRKEIDLNDASPADGE